MKIYVRKMFDHDVTHEVSVTREVVDDFFDSKNSFIISSENDNKEFNVTINAATDPRFGGDFKNLLELENVLSENSIFVIYKNRSKYTLKGINDSDPLYTLYNMLLSKKDRHLLFITDEEAEKRTIFDIEGTGENQIIYGTPGCGKSYYVDHELLKDYDKEHNVIRTTFYQDYTNTDFVGQILPMVKEDKSVEYDFIPGPFTIALNRAIQSPSEKVALVIEELNRGNAPSIFGDIFQLLDRKDGISEYKITNVGIQSYLHDQNPNYQFDYIKIPGNLSIFATMNTSDQNVFTLDTAFKRRWKFHKIKNTFEGHPFKDKFVPGLDINWKCFCDSINKAIIEDENFINSEDKQLGVYFVDESTLTTKKEDLSSEDSRKEFAYKVLEYLWDDVAKFSRKEWFGDVKSLDKLIEDYEKNGKAVFKKVVFKEDKEN